ncbi:MAG: hypothetical protein VX463_11380 [Pseudomonadota bacterium]|nr:hypothetical protein [Pseudomonadota bacterium]
MSDPSPRPDPSPRKVTLRLNPQQLDLVDRTVARLGLADRPPLVRLALAETDAAPAEARK